MLDDGGLCGDGNYWGIIELKGIAGKKWGL